MNLKLIFISLCLQAILQIIIKSNKTMNKIRSMLVCFLFASMLISVTSALPPPKIEDNAIVKKYMQQSSMGPVISGYEITAQNVTTNYDVVEIIRAKNEPIIIDSGSLKELNYRSNYQPALRPPAWQSSSIILI